MISLRSALAGGLSGAAAVLSGASRLTRTAASVVRPSPRDRPAAAPPAAAPPADGGMTPPAVSELEEERARLADVARAEADTARAPAAEDTAASARVDEGRIAELATRPVAEIRTEVRRLSTDELELLYHHESEHKGRKTVLRAIEQALSPDS